MNKIKRSTIPMPLSVSTRTTLKYFRILAKEFEDIGDDEIITWLELSEPFISKAMFGKLYQQALALFAAHRLKLAQKAADGTGDMLNVSNYSEGRVSIGFGNNPASIAENTDELFTKTVYGVQYLEIRNRVRPPLLL